MFCKQHPLCCNVLYLVGWLFLQFLECSVPSKFCFWKVQAVLGYSHRFQEVLGFFSHFLARVHFQWRYFQKVLRSSKSFSKRSPIILECSNAFFAFYTLTMYTTHHVFLPLFIVLISLMMVNF